MIRVMGLELSVPDHTTLSRRGRTVDVPSLPRNAAGPLHLVIDSTGLKIVNGGQWNSDKHGDSKKRRQWRKLHLGIDLGGFIVVSALTDSSEDNGCVGVDLLGRLVAPVASFGPTTSGQSTISQRSLQPLRYQPTTPGCGANSRRGLGPYPIF